jgi:hypothetical protein
MLENYVNKKIYQIGRETITHINNYAKSRSDKDLNEVFYCLVVMGSKVLFQDVGGIEHSLVEEWVYILAEDTIIVIANNPEKFVHQDNFFAYYKTALKITAKRMYAQKYEQQAIHIPIEEYMDDYPVFAHIDRTDTNLLKRDECGILIDSILKTIKKFPRFSTRANYLAWPVIFALIDRSDLVLDTPDYRDRIALRMLMRLIEQRIPGILHDLEV